MSVDIVARALALRARVRTSIAIGILGQSNERGQVDPAEAIGGIASRTAYPQAYRSSRNRSLRFPIAPALAKQGGMWFRLYDDLHDWGYDAHLVNSGIGSLSMVRDAAGQIQTRANATGYRQKRAPIGGQDRGYAGDYMVVQGRVFLCTKGLLAYASYGGGFNDTNGALDLDYIRSVGSQATAASEPAGLATAAVGDVVVDGTIEWTCLSASTSYLGLSYTAGNILSETRPGFDPFGLLHRVYDELNAVRDARHRIVLLANAQSDTGNLAYQQALEGIGAFFLQRGIKVAIGLSFYQPATGTTGYNNLTTRVDGALTSLRASGNIPVYYAAADVLTGANLYTLLGSTGVMAAGGGYFAKDSGQDNIHVNAAGAIAGGAAWASALKAVLPRL